MHDSAKSKLTKNNFEVGYKTGDFQLHTNVNDGSEFASSIYQKVSDKLETAVNLAWTAGNNSTRFGVATKYQLDSNASISAKVNNASLIGVGYTQTLRPENINAGGHKLGLGLDLEAWAPSFYCLQAMPRDIQEIGLTYIFVFSTITSNSYILPPSVCPQSISDIGAISR